MAGRQGGVLSTHGPEPSPEELAALAEQLRSVRLEQVVASTIATALELGFTRTGLAPGTEEERDLPQVEMAVEIVRALLPLLERAIPRDAALAYRQALSELQLAYARLRDAGAAGAPPSAPAGGEPPPERPEPSVEPPPRPRIWTPGGEV